MSNYHSTEPIESTVVLQQQTEALTNFDDFKAVFYQLNAKPDSDIRLLPHGKIVAIADIRSINDQVGAKIRNHNVIAEITSINFVLSNRKLKDFSTWAEFERETWDTINDKVESISINWDMSIKLPQYALPQRHSMKLRIGNAIPLRDMFQLVLTSDDISELITAESHGICKVDFINSIIAIELLNIVSNWHEGLKNSPKLSPTHQFLRKQADLISEVIKYLCPILLLILTCVYSDYMYRALGIEQEKIIYSIQSLAIIMTIVFTIGIVIGDKFERSMYMQLRKIETFPSFSITRGDVRATEEFEENNNKLTKKIINRFLLIIFSFSITSSLKFLIDYFSL